VVLYHSLFGNTKSVASSLATGIEETGVETICQSIDDFNTSDITSFDLIAIGSPTHILKPSKPMSEFLETLRTYNLEGKFGFTFDTRNESRMNKRSLSILENSAARSIEGKMKKMGMTIIHSRESAIVQGREGPLNQGSEERFLMIGKKIAKKLITQLESA
jgi:flavodoxin